MMKLFTLFFTLAALCGAAGAVDAQNATEFCAAYETTCKDIGTNFANTTACETWYSAADAGTLADPISDTAAGATQACYQYHLSAAAGGAAAAAATCTAPVPADTAKCEAVTGADLDTDAKCTAAACTYTAAVAGAATTHCPHAKGTAVCVAPPAVDAKAAKDAKAVKDAEAAEAAADKAKVDEAAKVRVVFAPVRIPRAAQMCPLLTFLAPVEPYILIGKSAPAHTRLLFWRERPGSVPTAPRRLCITRSFSHPTHDEKAKGEFA